MIRLNANLYILSLNAKTAHWNIEGVHFYGFHKVLDELDEFCREVGDKVAESCRFNGENPDLSLDVLKDLSLLNDVYTTANIKRIVSEILEDVETVYAYSEEIREDNSACENAIVDEVQMGLSKYIYLLRSMSEGL